MDTLTTPDFKLIKKVKDDLFDVDELHNYALYLQVGNKDMQFCINDKRNKKCLLLEEFAFEGIKTVKDRLTVVRKIFESHHLLMAGFWHSITFSAKTHKFTLVPDTHFHEANAVDYLIVNSEINSKIEEVYYYKHHKSGAVNVFTADRKLLSLLKEVYKSKPIKVVHQGSALIEGIMQYSEGGFEKTMFLYVDKGIIHLLVAQNQKLLYYNQFSFKISNDFLKYVMLVFKEHELSQKQTKLVVWGNISEQSPHLLLLRKYIKNISLGERPIMLNYGYQFDEIPEHYYFDVFSMDSCV